MATESGRKKYVKTQSWADIRVPNGTLIDCGEGFRLNIKLDVLKNVSQKGWWRQKVGEKV